MIFKRMLPKLFIAHFVLFTAQICFSGWHIIGSLALKEGADPFVFVLYRELFASLLMVAYVKYCKLQITIDKCDYYRFMWLGLFSFINVVGAMLALKYISATRFAIFQPSIPCIATLISMLLKMESLTYLKAIGILLSVGGAVTAEAWKDDSNDDSEESNVTLGTIIVSCQVIGMACLIVFSKPMVSKYPPPVVTVVYYSIGSLYTVLLCAIFAYTFIPSDLVFNGELLPWLGLGYASTFATFYPYNAYSWAGNILVPGITTIYCTFQPIGTILLSFIIFSTIITLSEGLGTALVIIGLLVTVYSQYNNDKTHHSHTRVNSDEIIEDVLHNYDNNNQINELLINHPSEGKYYAIDDTHNIDETVHTIFDRNTF